MNSTTGNRKCIIFRGRTLTALILFSILAFPPLTSAQDMLSIPDSGWRLWIDRQAAWENDTVYLPQDAVLSKLPVNPPTGGWEALDRNPGVAVTLPSTVEDHYWGAFGLRPYRDEYFYEAQDTAVKNGNYLGVSWWWRDIDIPKSFEGKHVTLFIRGARLRAEVFLNQQLIGYNIITETSFTCDASNAIRPGEKNRLAIRITNPGGRLDWLDTQLMPWGKTEQRFHRSHGFGGLDRGLYLRAHGPVFLTDVWVLNKPAARSVSAQARIKNSTDQTTTGNLVVAILDPESPGKVCAFQRRDVLLSPRVETVFETDLEFKEAQLWSDKSPRLYRLAVRLTSTTQEKSGRRNWGETREVNFGFRWFEADGTGKNAVLRLNGERIRLISAISWGFWGINGLWPTKELAEREVRAAKAFGMNCIQFHRNVGKTEVLDAQDRLGLLRFMEPGGGQTAFGERFTMYAPSPAERIDNSGKNGDAETFAEKYMEEKIVRMVRDHRSHPSLLMYCIQNEIHPDLRNPRIFQILRRVHEEDPSRIVVLKSGFPSGSYPVNQAWMQPYSAEVLHDTGDAYSGWWDDHTVGGPGVWRDEMYKGPGDFTHRSTNEKEIIVWGEMLGAAAPDNHAAMVRELESRGGKSYDLQEHREILAAYDRFLNRWGFQRAFRTPDALFVALGNKSYDFWGRVIETARLAEANDYFVISGWESTVIENHSGLVDNLRGFKGDPSLIRRGLMPLRPVVKTNSLVYAKGTQANIDLFLLNETHRPHERRIKVDLINPTGVQSVIGTYDVPAYERDRFVYPVSMGVFLKPFTMEGRYTVKAALVGTGTVQAEEKLLVVDVPGAGQLPRRIGILSSNPELMKPFDLFPGASALPFSRGENFDVLIAAGRFNRPPETQTDPGTEIQGTDDDELYRSISYGDPSTLEFLFPGLPGGAAKVTLKFAEIFQNAEGLRLFDVAINGQTVLKDFDVFKAAGGKNIAYDRTFEVPAADGVIHITFPRVPRPSARICAIRIQAGDTVVAVNCGGKKYTDKTGLVWRPYEPPLQFTDDVLRLVAAGMPLLVLAEGEAALAKYAEELSAAGAFQLLGIVGEARASWMGSWYFVRKHPVYDGLPVNGAMGSYYQVPVTSSCAIMAEGKHVEVFAGYSRDHDRNIGAASFSTLLGEGRILFHSIPGLVSGLRGTSAGMHPVLARRLIANSLRYLIHQ